MLSYFVSVKYTTVSIAVLLLYTAPIYVILLSPLTLKEPISAVVFAFVILNQPITSTILAGGGLILLSALMVSGKGPVEAVHK